MFRPGSPSSSRRGGPWFVFRCFSLRSSSALPDGWARRSPGYRLQALSRGGRPLTEPQWFAWIAGYSYNWICNSGLPACYFEFGDQQYADRIRVYDTIGAKAAAAVLRDADQAFGEAGPPPIAVERGAAWSAELHRRLEALGPRFSACKYEIFTCIFLYSLDHPGDFKGVAGQ